MDGSEDGPHGSAFFFVVRCDKILERGTEVLIAGREGKAADI